MEYWYLYEHHSFHSAVDCATSYKPEGMCFLEAKLGSQNCSANLIPTHV